jgi:hypothetical protein
VSRAEHAVEDISPLPSEEEATLLAALEAALRPGELSATLNERLIEVALEDPLAPPSEAELLESERLRGALDDGATHEDAALLEGLRASSGPESVDRAVERALARALPRPKPRRNVIYAVFGAGGVLAAAAAALLLVTQPRPPEAALTTDAYARSRSTASMFNERFETVDTSARMDAIASVRGRELRDNRYAAWGVR